MVKGVAIQAGGHGDGVRYKRGAMRSGPTSRQRGGGLRYRQGGTVTGSDTKGGR